MFVAIKSFFAWVVFADSAPRSSNVLSMSMSRQRIARAAYSLLECDCSARCMVAHERWNGERSRQHGIGLHFYKEVDYSALATPVVFLQVVGRRAQLLSDGPAMCVLGIAPPVRSCAQRPRKAAFSLPGRAVSFPAPGIFVWSLFRNWLPRNTSFRLLPHPLEIHLIQVDGISHGLELFQEAKLPIVCSGIYDTL